MAFFKDKLGAFLFILTYIMIIFVSLGVLNSKDNSDSSFILYHKTIFYITCILVIVCHIQSAITDPGVITNENNIRLLELYVSTHSHCIANAEKYNIKFRDLLQEEKEENDYLTEDDNYDFGHEYDIKNSIRDSAMTDISTEFKIKLSRCRKCLVVRVPNAHHCTKCKGCVLKYDHHCPWINNCVGMFNKKHFILFCYYCLQGTFHAMIIFSYYFIYKNYKTFSANLDKIIFAIFFYTFGIIFLIFSIVMLWNQWNEIKGETSIIDFKAKKFLEARDLSECIVENFGGPLSFYWFIPVNRNEIFDYFKGKIKPKIE